MSVDFYPALDATDGIKPALRCACSSTGLDYPCAACAARVNMSNVNACDMLVYLGLEPTPVGVVRADKLAELCRARLAMPNLEPERPTTTVGNLTTCGRDADYLPRQARALLVVATLARSCGWVAWS